MPDRPIKKDLSGFDGDLLESPDTYWIKYWYINATIKLTKLVSYNEVIFTRR